MTKPLYNIGDEVWKLSNTTTADEEYDKDDCFLEDIIITKGTVDTVARASDGFKYVLIEARRHNFTYHEQLLYPSKEALIKSLEDEE